MITIKDDRVVIELSHPCPDEFVTNLKESIIATIQAQDRQAVNTEELQDANNTLLELLRSII